MITPEYIVVVKPRKWEWPERHVHLPTVISPPSGGFANPAYETWRQENWWIVDFTVHVSNVSHAKELAKELWAAYKENDQIKIQRALGELRSLRVIPFEKRTPQEKWSHMAVQLPSDIGGPNKNKIRELLSMKCQGRILEAMCGFNSYLESSPNREIIALDYCREALERYPYPERVRILFDLNMIRGKKSIKFFREGEFDAITICFGFNYLHHPVIVFREFRRLLSSGGRLILVENPHQGYWDIARRSFSPTRCVAFLRQASFKDILVEELPIAEDWEQRNGGQYFLVEALRS